MTVLYIVTTGALMFLQVVSSEWVELTGTFQDGQQSMVEIAFDTSTMLVVVHKPDQAGRFRETSNLHIFYSHLVAIKDDRDKTCFIQRFNTSLDEMKDRVKEAKEHNYNIGPMKKVWIDINNLYEFEPESVKHLFGSEIACFCRLYKVVHADTRHSGQTDNSATVPHARQRRAFQMKHRHIIDLGETSGPVGRLC